MWKLDEVRGWKGGGRGEDEVEEEEEEEERRIRRTGLLLGEREKESDNMGVVNNNGVLLSLSLSRGVKKESGIEITKSIRSCLVISLSFSFPKNKRKGRHGGEYLYLSYDTKLNLHYTILH
jgi:hypothetical protein